MSIQGQDSELYISIFYSGQILPSGNPLTHVLSGLTASATEGLELNDPCVCLPIQDILYDSMNPSAVDCQPTNPSAQS